MENSRNPQAISFKLYTILSSIIKSCTIPLCSAQGVNHSFVQCMLPACQSLGHLAYQTPTQLTFILLNNGFQMQKWCKGHPSTKHSRGQTDSGAVPMLWAHWKPQYTLGSIDPWLEASTGLLEQASQIKGCSTTAI